MQRYGIGVGFLFYTGLSIPALIAATLLESAPSEASKNDKRGAEQEEVQQQDKQQQPEGAEGALRSGEPSGLSLLQHLPPDQPNAVVLGAVGSARSNRGGLYELGGEDVLCLSVSTLKSRKKEI